jgi:hypothetical protein
MVNICRQKQRRVFWNFFTDNYGTGYGYPVVEFPKNMNLKFDNICGYLRQYKKNMLDYNRLNLTEEVVNSSISIYQERYHLSLF